MCLPTAGVGIATLQVEPSSRADTECANVASSTEMATALFTLAAKDAFLDAATRARISALSPEPPPATDRNEEVTAHNYGAR